MTNSSDTRFTSNFPEAEITPLEPLGLKNPLLPPRRLGQTFLSPKFLSPLGATPLAVLDTSAFFSQEIPGYNPPDTSFQDFPFFGETRSLPEPPETATHPASTGSQQIAAVSPIQKAPDFMAFQGESLPQNRENQPTEETTSPLQNLIQPLSETDTFSVESPLNYPAPSPPTPAANKNASASPSSQEGAGGGGEKSKNLASSPLPPTPLLEEKNFSDSPKQTSEAISPSYQPTEPSSLHENTGKFNSEIVQPFREPDSFNKSSAPLDTAVETSPPTNTGGRVEPQPNPTHTTFEKPAEIASESVDLFEQPPNPTNTTFEEPGKTASEPVGLFEQPPNPTNTTFDSKNPPKLDAVGLFEQPPNPTNTTFEKPEATAPESVGLFEQPPNPTNTENLETLEASPPSEERVSLFEQPPNSTNTENLETLEASPPSEARVNLFEQLPNSTNTENLENVEASTNFTASISEEETPEPEQLKFSEIKPSPNTAALPPAAPAAVPETTAIPPILEQKTPIYLQQKADFSSRDSSASAAQTPLQIPENLHEKITSNQTTMPQVSGEDLNSLEPNSTIKISQKSAQKTGKIIQKLSENLPSKSAESVQAIAPISAPTSEPDSLSLPAVRRQPLKVVTDSTVGETQELSESSKIGNTPAPTSVTSTVQTAENQGDKVSIPQIFPAATDVFTQQPSENANLLETGLPGENPTSETRATEATAVQPILETRESQQTEILSKKDEQTAELPVPFSTSGEPESILSEDAVSAEPISVNTGAIASQSFQAPPSPNRSGTTPLNQPVVRAFSELTASETNVKSVPEILPKIAKNVKQPGENLGKMEGEKLGAIASNSDSAASMASEQAIAPAIEALPNALIPNKIQAKHPESVGKIEVFLQEKLTNKPTIQAQLLESDKVEAPAQSEPNIAPNIAPSLTPNIQTKLPISAQEAETTARDEQIAQPLSQAVVPENIDEAVTPATAPTEIAAANPETLQARFEANSSSLSGERFPETTAPVQASEISASPETSVINNPSDIAPIARAESGDSRLQAIAEEGENAPSVQPEPSISAKQALSTNGEISLPDTPAPPVAREEAIAAGDSPAAPEGASEATPISPISQVESSDSLENFSQKIPQLPAVLQNISTLQSLAPQSPTLGSNSPPESFRGFPPNLQKMPAETLDSESDNFVRNTAMPTVQVPPLTGEREPFSLQRFAANGDRASNQNAQPTGMPSRTAAMPNSWSNIAELLGESSEDSPANFGTQTFTQMASSLGREENNFDGRSPESPSASTGATIPDDAIAADRAPAFAREAIAPPTPPSEVISTAENPSKEAKDKDSDNQESHSLEILAREIYGLVRQRLEIERERRGNYYSDRLPF